MTARWVWRLLPVVGVVLAIAGWEFLVGRSDSLFFIPPSEVLGELRTEYIDGDIASEHLVPSVSRLLRGWLTAIVAGIGLGMLLGLRPALLPWVNPIIHIGRSIPPPALVGVFFLAFGAGDAPKVTLIAFAAMWPVLFNTVDAVRSFNPTQLETARCLQLSSRTRLTHVILPGVAPKVFPGVRASLSIALILMVITEFTSSINGLGKVLADQRNFFDWTGVWGTLVVLALLGLTLNTTLVLVEHRIIRWHRAMTGVAA